MPNLKDEPSLQQLYSSVHNQLYASQKDLYTWLQVLEEIARSPQFGMLYHRMQRQLATVQVRLQQAALALVLMLCTEDGQGLNMLQTISIVGAFPFAFVLIASMFSLLKALKSDPFVKKSEQALSASTGEQSKH